MARTKELTDQSGPRGTAWPRSSPRRRNQPKARFSALSAPRRWRCAPVIGVVDTDPADPGHGRPALFPACVVAGLRSASASDRAPWIRVLRIRKLRLRRCSLDIAQQHGGSERKQDDGHGHVLPNYRLNGSRRTQCCACEARITATGLSRAKPHRACFKRLRKSGSMRAARRCVLWWEKSRPVVVWAAESGRRVGAFRSFGNVVVE